MLVLIDNYDSFTYNLVQAFGLIEPGLDIRVFRNDQVGLDQIAELRPSHIVVSPGPCTPNEAGISNAVVERFAGHTPLLGVCLGHQCIGHVYGAAIVRAGRLVHGKTSLIRHDGSALFRGLSNPFEATRYHSLLIDPDTLPADFVVTATCVDDPREIMAVQHKRWPLFGVQFHPESFLSVEGPRLLANFLAVH
ncbi:MAG: aminodeoxychorismate/anthranilate synthase component II [Phycisphaerae bacterium]|nr:aminodeoxychorismate/anthranilate synthase component II [Phycisphaerae bacterium]MCZ2400558.1 aminodeoxychorismate/anthranilate synthase component II [Phycisphaerae bacterium]